MLKFGGWSCHTQVCRNGEYKQLDLTLIVVFCLKQIMEYHATTAELAICQSPRAKSNKNIHCVLCAWHQRSFESTRVNGTFNKVRRLCYISFQFAVHLTPERARFLVNSF